MAEDEEEIVWRVSRNGYERVWSWIRLTCQMHEIECHEAGIGITDDECPMEHQVAFLIAMLLPPLDVADAANLFEGDPDA